MSKVVFVCLVEGLQGPANPWESHEKAVECQHEVAK